MTSRANKYRGEVEFNLGGRDIRLVPSYANLIAVEEVCGCGIVEVARSLAGGGAKIRDVVNIIAVASEPKLADEEVIKEIEQTGILPLARLVAKFLIDALTGGVEGKQKAAKENI